MISSIPSLLVPIVGLIFPTITMLSFFLFAEKENLN